MNRIAGVCEGLHLFLRISVNDSNDPNDPNDSNDSNE